MDSRAKDIQSEKNVGGKKKEKRKSEPVKKNTVNDDSSSLPSTPAPLKAAALVPNQSAEELKELRKKVNEKDDAIGRLKIDLQQAETNEARAKQAVEDAKSTLKEKVEKLKAEHEVTTARLESQLKKKEAKKEKKKIDITPVVTPVKKIPVFYGAPDYLIELDHKIKEAEAHLVDVPNHPTDLYIYSLRTLCLELAVDFNRQQHNKASSDDIKNSSAGKICTAANELIDELNDHAKKANPDGMREAAAKFAAKCDETPLSHKILKAAAAVIIGVLAAAAILTLTLLAITCFPPLIIMMNVSKLIEFTVFATTALISLAGGATAGTAAGFAFFKPAPLVASALKVADAAQLLVPANTSKP